ncbi:ComEA family DNA-binding protein [Erysipelotrichaceae bacterium RD49]|nr:ComEA family DNA-binding protein [Erysipelotrichaceae bacterium RD49]
MKTIQKAAGPLLFLLLGFVSLAGRMTPMALERQAPDTIEAEIKGAVALPGVYTLKNGATIQELIVQAGGESEAADLSMLNLLETVHAGQVIVVGKKNLDGSSPRISLNTASAEELMKLPGIGPAMAEKIIAYRAEHPFETIEQLMEVPGIGEKKFAKLQDFIAL